MKKRSSSPRSIVTRLSSRRSVRAKLRDGQLSRIVPSVATILGLCVGLSSIRFALQERWEYAVAAILFAAIFDVMDGRLARWLEGTSHFGAELDSLADFVNFGVAPALVTYLYTLHEWGGAGWFLVLFFSICSCLRLARFNTANVLKGDELPEWAHQFFIGAPMPIAATIILLPMMIDFNLHIPYRQPLMHGILIAGVGLLMISRLPTYSIKGRHIPSRWVPFTLLVAGITAAGLIIAPWATLSFFASAYLITIPFSIRAYQKLSIKPSAPR